MALSENLANINSSSKNPIDKIVQQGAVTITNSGATGEEYQRANIVQSSILNNYGRAGLVRAKWSIDGGTTWQGLESEILYIFTVSTISGDPGHPSSVNLKALDSAISIGCSDSLLTFRTANGKHGNVAGTQPGGITYTPTSRTFTIQYALYERL